MENGPASGVPARRKYLFWSTLTFMALLVAAALIMPAIISDGDYLGDPAFWAALPGIPAFGVVLWLLRRGDDVWAGRAFVAIAMAVAWVFTILIQGSGYLVGNYAYLSVIVLFAAFFLSARATALYAGLNIVGVIVIHNVWGLALTDLALSLAYLVIFCTMLVLIAGLFEKDAVSLQRAHRRVAEADREKQQILDQAGDAIFKVDPDGRLVHANGPAQRLAARLLGGDLRPGQDVVQMMPLNWRQQATELWNWARLRGQFSDEFSLQHDDRDWRLHVRIAASPDSSTAVFISDITTEHQRREEERKRIEKEAEVRNLERLNQLQRDFINMASHELQTPLTPLRLQLHLLRRTETGPLNEAQLQSIQVMERNVVRMGRLVDDILEVVRAENHRLSVSMGRTEIVALIEECVENIEPLCMQRKVVIDYDGPEEAWAYADASRVTQVLGNLLANAAKFVKDGGHIMVKLSTSGEDWVVAVRDDGIGFPPEKAERLFQPFSQLHGHTAQYGGTGLGLVICKGIMEAMGGQVEAHSDGPDKGATFRFTLRSMDAEDPVQQRSRRSPS